MQKVLPSGLASLRGRLARTIASNRIFNLTVHCTLNSLINNDFSVYSMICKMSPYRIEARFSVHDVKLSFLVRRKPHSSR